MALTNKLHFLLFAVLLTLSGPQLHGATPEGDEDKNTSIACSVSYTGDVKLPAALAEKYEVMSVLKTDEEAIRLVVLIKDRVSKAYRILKINKAYKRYTTNEHFTLKSLELNFIPQAIDYDRGDLNEPSYLIQSYINHPTMHAFLDQLGFSGEMEMTQEKALSLLKILRNIFLKLHDLHEAGYAHMDVLNTNILIGPEHDIHLIDFEFAQPLGQMSMIHGHNDFSDPDIINAYMFRQEILIIPGYDFVPLRPYLEFLIAKMEIPILQATADNLKTQSGKEHAAELDKAIALLEMK